MTVQTIVALPVPVESLTALPVTLPGVMSAVASLPGGGVAGWGMMHTQSTPAATWTIPVPPSFGRLPAVQVYLTSGEPVIVDFMASLEEVYITFPSPTSGYAVLT